MVFLGGLDGGWGGGGPEGSGGQPGFDFGDIGGGELSAGGHLQAVLVTEGFGEPGERGTGGLRLFVVAGEGVGGEERADVAFEVGRGLGEEGGDEEE